MDIKKEIKRFLMAGVVINAADFGIYYFLFHFLSFSLSKGISFTCAGVAGYFLNKYWTFKQARLSYAEAGRYALINLLALAINVSVNQSILNKWPGAVGPALAAAAAVTSLWAFLGFKYWVYKAQLTVASPG